MEAFLGDLGVPDRYRGKLEGQGITCVTDATALTTKQLDKVLETIGMDCNPGHVSRFKKGLKAHVEKRKAEDDASGETNNKADAATDPAEAVRSAMSAAKQRGGGVVGGGDAVKRPSETADGEQGASHSGGLSTQGKVTPASETEVTEILENFRKNDFFALFGFPDAPVDDRGKVDWKGHPVSKSNDVALKAKLLSFKLDPTLPGAHALAAEALSAVLQAAKTLDDPELKKEILTQAVRKRVAEMRQLGIGDLHGGYVSLTGVHYAAGAAAAQVNDYLPDQNGEGPAMNPAARLRAGLDKVGGKGEHVFDDPEVSCTARVITHTTQKSDDELKGTHHAESNQQPPAVTKKQPSLDLGSIRDKLKKKRKNFM